MPGTNARQGPLSLTMAEGCWLGLPPAANTEARAKYVAKLFLSREDQARHAQSAKLLCSTQSEHDIGWAYFCWDWTWKEVTATVDMLCSDATTDSCYLGVTSCPVWRWRLCRDHTDGFRPHCGAYDRMRISCVERCGPALVLVEWLIEPTRISENSDKLRSATRYVTGPVKPKQILFVYCCIKTRPLDEPCSSLASTEVTAILGR